MIMFGVKLMNLNYSKIENNEFLDMIIISIVISFLLSITFLRFSETNESFAFIFITFVLFFFIMLFLRLLTMKIYGSSRCGTEVFMYQTHFDRFWINPWDRMSYHVNNKVKNSSFKGFPMTFISVIIYILTLGTIVFTSVWNYKYKKIPHIHLGTQKHGEVSMSHLYNVEISDVRISRILFTGFLFYFIFGLLVKVLFSEFSLYYWFLFIIFWTGFISLIPILGTEGYELWSKGRFLWFSAFATLVLGMLSLLIFQSILYVLLLGGFSIILVIFVYFYKDLMGGGH